jgi:hypothetical protein
MRARVLPVVWMVMVSSMLAGLAGSSRIQEGGASASLRARRAVGDETTLAQLRSLVVSGHTNVLVGGTGGAQLKPRSIEIRVLLPDNYLRLDNDSRVLFRSGFSAGDLLNAATPLQPDVNFSASYGPEQLHVERIRFLYLTLGMLAYVPAILPLEVRAKGPDTIEVSVPEGLSALLDLDSSSHLPLRLRYQGDVRFPTPGSLLPPPPERAEISLHFEDRRVVGGLKLPHRITRKARDVTFEEMIFDKILVNPPLTPKDFRN